MENTSTVHTTDLHKHYGKVQALKGINLEVEKGKIFGLLGPNGAGKTTLIRLLTGAIKSTSGELAVLGLNPSRKKRDLRRMIGYMPQTPALYEDLSARANIRFFCGAFEIEDLKSKVDRAIEFVGLTERANDPVYKFSGGMKQRVSLACALAHDPRLLLLDEPTSGIDPQLRDSFWKHFRSLTERGTTIVVSTHQMDEAMHCDQLAILHQGIKLADDQPEKIMWEKKAKIRFWQGGKLSEFEAANYPDQLPVLLRKYGLSPEIDRIEIQENTLEEVVLAMIDEHNHKQALEVKDNANH